MARNLEEFLRTLNNQISGFTHSLNANNIMEELIENTEEKDIEILGDPIQIDDNIICFAKVTFVHSINNEDSEGLISFYNNIIGNQIDNQIISEEETIEDLNTRRD